jgi:uncharacterized protein YggE
MEPAAPAHQVTPGFTEHFVQEKKFSWGMIGWAILGIVLLAIFWQWVTNPMIVTVTGTGQVNVPATDGTITFSVTDNDPTPQGAISGEQARADAIKQLLISSGIPEENIIESQVVAVPAALVTAGASGYQAQIAMSAKTVHITGINDLVASLYSNGATAVSQPVLSVENEQPLDQQAYNSAMQDANKQAGAIGLQNWKFIRKIIDVSNQSSGTTSTSSSKADVATGVKTPLANQNGVFQITENVTVTYKMW